MVLLVGSTALYASDASDASVQVIEAAAEEPGRNTTAMTSIPVAIVNFESSAPGNPNLGRQLSDIITARMSIYDQFQLIERQKLEDILKEHQLNLTGVVDTSQAISIGKLTGAKIMIFGSAFPVDKDIYLVAKVVGTETSQVKGVMAKGRLERDLSETIDQLVDKLADGLQEWTATLLPENMKYENKIAKLKKQLAGKTLPTVAVIVPETHFNAHVSDPAAQTEIEKVLREVGFDLIVVQKTSRNESLDDMDLRGVDIVITGQGFSEFGARIGGLVSCVARLEVQAVAKESRMIITSERTTRRAVDLAEGIAAKTALQAAGHELAINLVEKIVTSDIITSKAGDTLLSENEL